MDQANPPLRQRIVFLRWALPFILGLLAVLYEIGPGRRIHDDSVAAYFDLDIAFYGIVFPLLTFATLTILNRWFDRKERAERLARASEQRLAAIMTASADAIMGLDSSRHITSWNRGAEQLFGYTLAEVYGRPFSSLLGNSGAFEVEFDWLTRHVQRTGFLRGHETVCHNARGREVAVELTATHLTDESGHSAGMSVILRDITERRHRDEEIRRLNASLNEQVIERTRELAEKVEELARANTELQKLDQMRTEFVSVVSHQIRAPLTNMRGAMERMQGNCCAVNATCARMFVIFEQQAGRLDRLVKDTLSASRIEAGELVIQPEPMSILPVIERVVEQTRVRAANRPFHVSKKPGIPLVFADRDRTEEVLVNLLDNADKYSPPDREVRVDVRADQVEVTVSVQDNGPGLPSTDLDQVFDKFYRADNTDSQSAYGYGLGLYVCRQLITAQGGRIWAENRPGAGAVFSFTLPLAS